jgi:multidrug efflux system membrane fusion protein
MNRFFLFVCITISMLATHAGCERGVKVAPPDAAPVVPVSQPIQREVTDYVDYTGRTNAKDSVTIQPRVTGYLVTDDKEGRMAFKEGDYVEKGKVLFKIDPKPYQAQLEAATAAVAQNQAGLNYAKVTNLRYKEIAKKQPDAVSPRELDQYQAQEEQAIANLNLAKANLESAKLNLEWTVVRAPINGQVSRYFLTPGNLVNQDMTQLTTLVSMDPMYVYFDMDEPTLLRIKKAINDGTIVSRKQTETQAIAFGGSTFGLLGTPLSRGPFQASAMLYPGRHEPVAPVLMALAGEEFNPSDVNRQGVINFIDNQVNPGTGSILVRAQFDNVKPEGGTYLLVPGMFVRIRFPIGQPQQELLVIDRAVTSDQGLKYVYVLDEKNTVEARRVSVGALQEDGLRVITSGLKKDDWVLVGALQQVRPKMTVQSSRVSMPSLIDAATSLDDKGKEKTKKGKKK